MILNLMEKYNVNKFVFTFISDSHRNPHTYPITENFLLSTISPYGTTKLMIEDMCKDTWNWQSKNPNGYKEEALINA